MEVVFPANAYHLETDKPFFALALLAPEELEVRAVVRAAGQGGLAPFPPSAAAMLADCAQVHSQPCPQRPGYKIVKVRAGRAG